MLGFKRRASGARGGPAVYVTFFTTAEAFAFKAACEQDAIPGALATVPRRLSAGCGMAWRAPASERGRIEEAIARRGLEYEEVCELDA